MTIALGILAGDSMVLAADTEVTTDYLKMESGKIRFVVDAMNSTKPQGTLVVTGAGNLGYLNATFHELQKVFLAHPAYSMDQLENRLKKTVAKFHREHVAPLVHTQAAPSISLIIAARRGDYHRMWETENSALWPVDSYASVGAGTVPALELLGRVKKPMDVTTAMAIAAYAVYRVKRAVRDCGQHTQVVRIDASVGLPFPMTFEQLEELGKLFDFYETLLGMQLHWILGSEYDFAKGEHVARLMEQAKAEIARVLHISKSSNSDISQR